MTDREKWLTEPWRAQPNNLIGGWCVTLADDPRTPADEALLIADFVSEEVANHVVKLHNKEVQRRTWTRSTIPEARGT